MEQPVIKLSRDDIPPPDRRFVRMRDRELEKISSELSTVFEAFTETLFTTDWDSPAGDQVNPFKIFNDIWLNYCRHHKKTSKAKTLEPMGDAFYKYAMDQGWPGDSKLEFSATQINGANDQKTGEA